jgi:molybdenum cofactor guanylyltransferase
MHQKTNAPGKLSLAAAVMAGGRSLRMGRDKAMLEYEGERLIDRQISLLRFLSPAELLISGRPGHDYGVTDITVVHDELPDCGPLGGLAALLRACASSHLLILAVDMPLMSVEMLRELTAAVALARGTVPCLGEAWEPLAAIYPIEILPRVQNRLDAGRRSMRRLIEEAIAHKEMRSYPVPFARQREFANWNYPHENL